MTELLVRWVGLVSKHARSCMAAILVLTLGFGWIAVTQFRINSDLSQLIDQTSDWRVDFDRFEAEFPDLIKTAVIVVSGSSITAVEDVTAEIVTRLEDMDERFASVAAPGAEAFFRDHALLYLDLDRFDDVIDRLAEAQPLINEMSRGASLGGVFDLVRDALENETDAPLGTMVSHLLSSGEGVLAGRTSAIAWADEFFATEGLRYQLIYVKPISTFDEALPDAEVMVALRNLRSELTLPEDVRVQFTGEIPLQHEEIEAAVTGVTMAGWLVLGLLLLVLIVGVRSGKIIAATFSMLAIGVLWTSAFAMLAVGEYNTLSIVFVVMFFGLGVDFALHFSLRFQEAVNRGMEITAEALRSSTRSVGRAIALCSLTTAVGFLGFWPTAYEGLADLGVICAGGMFIACFLTFTFLPAFYALVGEPRAHVMDLPTSEGVVQWLIARRGPVLIVVAAGGLAAAYGTSRVSFDYSVLAIKDPNSESMLALRELQREGLSTDYQLAIVADEPVDKSRLEELAVVRDVSVPSDQVPAAQDEKLEGLEELQFMYWDFLAEDIAPLQTDAQETRRRAALLRQVLTSTDTYPELSELLDQYESHDASTWLSWQAAMLDGLHEEMQWLQRALVVSSIDFQDIPKSVQTRLISPNGKSLSIVQPEQDIAKVDALSAFITDVKDIVPNVTGRPVIEWGVGRIVVNAFQQALVIAIVGISLILVITLRGVRIAVLVLCPLLLAALFTFSACVVFNIPLNMANILVLPLIFGLGVDNGIHVVDRFMGEGDVNNLMHSSTPRAVVLSSMTTIGAFAALSISPHMGTASIGLLLTISISLLLIFTIFLLPVLLQLAGSVGRLEK